MTACGSPPARRSCATGCSRARRSEHRCSCRAWFLPARGAIVDVLGESPVDFLDGHQRRRPGADETACGYGERKACGAHVVGKIDNPDYVVLAEREIEALDLAAGSLDGGGGRSH